MQVDLDNNDSPPGLDSSSNEFMMPEQGFEARKVEEEDEEGEGE